MYFSFHSFLLKVSITINLVCENAYDVNGVASAKLCLIFSH